MLVEEIFLFCTMCNAHLRMAAAVPFSFFDLLKKQTSFFTIQSSISLNLSCSSGLHSVTTVRTRSSKSFTCWKGSTKAFRHFNEKQMKNKQDIIKNMILRQSLWKWSLWHEVSLAWEVGGVPRRPATIKINSRQKWNTGQVHEIPAVFKGNFWLTTVDTI